MSRRMTGRNPISTLKKCKPLTGKKLNDLGEIWELMCNEYLRERGKQPYSKADMSILNNNLRFEVKRNNKD